MTTKENVLQGILIIDKPKGITSHDVVNIVRRLYGLKKVGHAGTLDPIATGVLVILIGSATKRSNSLTAEDKEYSVTMRLGAATDTGDALGKILYEKNARDLDRKHIEEAVFGFRGETEQTPPMYSAVKHKGKSLYKLARKGISVERRPRKITIKNIKIRRVEIPDVDFDVSCSKGTYVRQLCADIGEKIGCGAHMLELRRLRSGDFRISEAVRIEDLEKMGSDELKSILIQ